MTNNITNEQGLQSFYEKRYMVNSNQYYTLIKRFVGKMEADIFTKGIVSNIYFDTPTRLIAANELQNPKYDEKLLIKSFGSTPKPDDEVTVQIKKRYDNIYYSRETKMPLRDAKRYLYFGYRPYSNQQIFKEIDSLMDSYKSLRPSMYISAHRLSFNGISDNNLKINFDSRICYRDKNLKLEGGNFGDSLISPDKKIMQINLVGSMPTWLSEVLGELELSNAKFSQYANACMHSKSKFSSMQKKEEGIICA